MATFELVLLLLAAVLVSSVLDQLIPRVSSPLIQIALGLALSLLAADQIAIEFDSSLFLLLFIAPLLYDESRCADKAMLARTIKPVLGLAIGLVFLTMLIVGYMTNLLIPSIPLTACFALAAALGPTDAVAVGSLPKNVQIGERAHNILKGEYLLNDASGIIAFQFAIAATVTGAFSLASASVSFVVSFFGGIIVGLLMGYLANWIVRYFRRIGIENTTFHVLFDLFLPFIIYLVSEPFGASGIIAVFAGGLVRSAGRRAVGPASSRLSIVSNSVWQVFNYALNGIVFVLLGTQLPRAMQSTWDSVVIENTTLVIYIVAITATLLAVRFVWLVFEEYFHQRGELRKEGALGSVPCPLFSRRNAYSALLMTLAGPKGAVTLSIVFTIPVLVDNGGFFPQRSLIIFLACGVILVTLVLSNFLLPAIAPKAHAPENAAERERAAVEANIEVLRRVIETLTARESADNHWATQRVIKEYAARIQRIKDNNDIESQKNTDLRVQVIEWEIAYVLEKIQKGQTDPYIGYRLINSLAKQEHALTHHGTAVDIAYMLARARSAVRHAFNLLKKKVPGVSPSENYLELNELHVEATRWVIERLQDGMTEMKYPSEDIGALVLELRRNVLLMQATNPSITAIGSQEAKRSMMVKNALRIEAEEIRNMYDEGLIDRALARHMQDNVLLMLVELEDDELT